MPSIVASSRRSDFSIWFYQVSLRTICRPFRTSCKRQAAVRLTLSIQHWSRLWYPSLSWDFLRRCCSAQSCPRLTQYSTRPLPCLPLFITSMRLQYCLSWNFSSCGISMWFNRYKGVEEYVPQDIDSVNLTPWKYRYLVSVVDILLAVGIYILFPPIGIAV